MRRVKVILTVLAMILLSGFTAGQLSAESNTEVSNEQFFKLLTEVETMTENEKVEIDVFKAKAEASELRAAEYRAKNAYKNAWLHSMSAKRYFDLIHGEGKWVTNIDYNKIAEEEAKKRY